MSGLATLRSCAISVCTVMFPLLVPSRKSNGILIIDIVTASYLVFTHFFVYLNSQTLVFTILPGTIDFYFLPLVATYQCVSTHLLRTAGLEGQVSEGTFLAWGSCLAWHEYKYLPISTFGSYLLFFTAVTGQNVPKSDTLHLVLQKSQDPLVCASLPQTQTVVRVLPMHGGPRKSLQASGRALRSAGASMAVLSRATELSHRQESLVREKSAW